MRTGTFRALAVVALTLSACESQRSGSPTDPLEPPQQVVESSTEWALDQTFVSVNGPVENCMVQDRQEDIGGGWIGSLVDVEITDGQAKISYWCGDWSVCEYSGELRGVELSARGESWSGIWTCNAGESFSYTATGDLNGAFADDFESFSGVERWMYETDSGRIVVTLEFRLRKAST